MGSNWKDTLLEIAPGIAHALGGPLGGIAVNIATKMLGIENDEQALAQVVASGNPEALQRLREADNEFELEKKKLNIQDRHSARELGIEKGLVIQAALSGLFVTGYFVIFGFVLYAAWLEVEFSASLLTLISTLIGIMTASVTQIMNYWFGSSSGSRAKDAAKAIKGLVTGKE